MAVFEVVEGQPGQGKSLYTARRTRQLIERNKRLLEKHNKFRQVASNMKYSEAFEKEHKKWIVYWSTLDDLVKLRDVDVIWDEIANELDSRNWPQLSQETKRFLSQYRKRGIDIYANTQDFSMVDARARLMITGVKTLTKIIGSPDISTTKPRPKVIWGFVWVRNVLNWKETNLEKKQYSLVDLLNWMIIEKDLTDIYDTTQDIPTSPPLPYKHEVRYCEYYGQPGHENCEYKRVLHDGR